MMTAANESIVATERQPDVASADHGASALERPANLNAACIKIGALYGSVLGATFGALFSLLAPPEPHVAMMLFAAAFCGVLGLVCGPLTGFIASRMGRRMLGPWGWAAAAAAGTLPLAAGLLLLGVFLAGSWPPPPLLLVPLWVLAIAAGAGAAVGAGIRRGESPLPRVNDLIAVIEETARTQPRRFGLPTPGELCPSPAPIGSEAEVSPAGQPEGIAR